MFGKGLIDALTNNAINPTMTKIGTCSRVYKITISHHAGSVGNRRIRPGNCIGFHSPLEVSVKKLQRPVSIDLNSS